MNLLLAAYALGAGSGALAQAHPGSSLGDLPMILHDDVRLTASEPKDSYEFGYSVAFAGDTALIGAKGPTLSADETPGEAYVFTREDGIWSEQARLTPSDGADEDHFGLAVALSEDGNTAVVGAQSFQVDPDVPGAVYVFTRDSQGVWSEQAKLTASDGVEDDAFGISVALSGDTLLVGAMFATVDGFPDRGAAYVFTRGEDGVWSEQAKLTDGGGDATVFFGLSVALEGETALVGAPWTAVDGNVAQGAVYVFTREDGVWSEPTQLTAADGAVADNFGEPLALAGDTALIGALQADVNGNETQGAVYVFTRDGETWSEQAKLTTSDGAAGDQLGALGLDLEGDTAMIGAAGVDVGGVENAGAAYIFVRQGGDWSEWQKLVVPDALAHDSLGDGAGLSGTTAVVGANSAREGEESQLIPGAAYVFNVLDLAIRPDPLDFGPVLVGQTRGPLSVTVANGSLEDVTVSGISEPEAPFTAAGGTCGPPPFTLAPGEECELAFGFGPSVPGDASTTLTITSDAPTPAATFDLQGRGSDDTLDIAPEIVDFGGVAPDHYDPPHRVTLANADATALEIDAVSAPDAPFSRVEGQGTCGNAPFTLEPFASCTLYYSFNPPDVGSFSSVVVVTSDAPDSSDSFTLLGEGLLVELTVTPETLDFGAVPVGEASEPFHVTLANTGEAEIVLAGISPPDAPFAFVEGTCGSGLPPGASCTLDYTFTPDAPGEFAGSVTIEATDPHTLALHGTGLGAAFDVDPRSLAATVAPGETETQPLEIRNLGNVPLEWAVTEEAGLAGRILVPVDAVTHPQTAPFSATVDGPARLTRAQGKGTARHAFPTPASGSTAITHSASSDIQVGNSIACTNDDDGTSVEGRYLRTFTLPDFDLLGSFDVTEVTFGIHSLTSSASLTVNLYTLDGELTYDNLTLIGTASEELAAQDLALVTLPVTGTAPASSTLVVEVVAPDLTGVGTFYPGANDQGETAPSYFAASVCGLDDPVTMADLGFPQLHLVMTVTGVAEEVTCALPTWVSVQPMGGSVPGGETEAADVTFDAGGLEPGVFGAHLCLASNDPTRPTVAVPLTLAVGDGATLAFTPASLDFGEVPVGTTSAPQAATLSNTGNFDAEGLAFDPPGGDFVADTSACGGTLPGGQSCEVSITFTPTVPGPATAVLGVNSEEVSASLDLSGNGVGDEGFTPVALQVDPAGLTPEANGLFEPGETVDVAPAWRNDGEVAASLAGTASDFTGPEGAAYSIDLDAADYGLIESDGTASCLDTEVCYRLGLDDPAARPAEHWDTTFDETLDDTDGTTHTWTLHIGESFADVPTTNPFYPAIETLLHSGITGGCAAGAEAAGLRPGRGPDLTAGADGRHGGRPLQGGAAYCPGGANSRAQMPVFMLRALMGSGYTPLPCVEGDPPFGDVPFDSPFCPWIQDLAGRGIVSGCGDGDYCPGNPVTRAQMAIFLLKTLEGADYEPAECAERFTDVVCPSLFADWIEDLAERGITGGCTTTEYCPGDAVTRAQMPVFVTRTFGLALYGP